MIKFLNSPEVGLLTFLLLVVVVYVTLSPVVMVLGGLWCIRQGYLTQRRRNRAASL